MRSGALGHTHYCPRCMRYWVHDRDLHASAYEICDNIENKKCERERTKCEKTWNSRKSKTP